MIGFDGLRQMFVNGSALCFTSYRCTGPTDVQLNGSPQIRKFFSGNVLKRSFVSRQCLFELIGVVVCVPREQKTFHQFTSELFEVVFCGGTRIFHETWLGRSSCWPEASLFLWFRTRIG